MPFIAYVGDTHGRIISMYTYLEGLQENYSVKLDAVVQIGDFGIYLQKFMEFADYWNGNKIASIPTYICPGNHEDWAVLEQWMEQPDKITNIHLMPDGEIVDIAGVKHGAIWGNYSYKSYRNPERVLTARRQHKESPKAMHILQSSVNKLMNAGEFDVFISHDASEQYKPTYTQPNDSIKMELGIEGEKASGCRAFSEIYDWNKPKFHFFGHFHRRTLLKPSEPRITCLGAFNHDIQSSIEVREFDEQS